MLSLPTLLTALVFCASTMAAPSPWGGWDRKRPATTTPAPAVAPIPVVPVPVAPVPAPVAAISSPALVPVVGGSVTPVPAPQTGGSEQHRVTMINNCGSGTPMFKYLGTTKMAATTVSGPLKGGVAWLDGFAGCSDNGVGCVAIEFTLINPGTEALNTISAVNYSILETGQHKFTYASHVEYDSPTCPRIGACTGNSGPHCPYSYLGTDTVTGPALACIEPNLGITISFC